MEVYMSDMMVNSKVDGGHFKHLDMTFQILRKYHMKLNPQKCVFREDWGKFQGFMVNHRGIEVNPTKI